MASDVKVEPCPFCGGEARPAPEAVAWANQVMWTIICPACGGRGGLSDTEAEAIAAWNQRTPATDGVVHTPIEAVARAFLETREFLGLLEPFVCNWACPTKWVTDEGQPHDELHKALQDVLFKHEEVRDAALHGQSACVSAADLLDRVLASSGARGRYDALEYADAVEAAEAHLRALGAVT